MASDPSTRGGEPPAGLMQSLRNLAATGVGMLQTRLELLLSEIEEERVRLLQLLVWGFAALLFLAFGLLMFTLAVVAAFWDTHRLLALLALGILYLVIGLALAFGARRRAERPKMFASSMAELRKDHETLGSS